MANKNSDGCSVCIVLLAVAALELLKVVAESRISKDE